MDLPDAIDLARAYTVQIAYTIKGLPDNRLVELKARGAIYSFPFGTGILASDQGHVVTAAHVLEEIEAFSKKVTEGTHIVGVGLAHGGSVPGRFRVIRYDIVATDPRNDLALLKLRLNPFGMAPEELETAAGGDAAKPAVAAFHFADPRDGEAIAISGYPLDEPALVTTSGVISSASSKSIEKTLLPDDAEGYKPADIADRYLSDARVNPGNSGGPAYAVKDAGVVGMVQSSKLRSSAIPGGTQQASGLATLVPARTIVDFMTANGCTPVRS